MRRFIALALAVATVAGLRIAGSSPAGVALVIVPQGVSAYTFDGMRVFVVRDGETLRGFRADSGRFGAAARWCPYEGLFWAPRHADLFDRDGRRIFGPVQNDMLEVPLRVSPQGTVEADVHHPVVHRATRGKILPSVLEFYQRYLNRHDAPLARPLVFCPGPLR